MTSHLYLLTIINFIGVFGLSNAFLNLYLSPKEVQKLFGIDAQIYYIKEGSVQHNAVKFPIDVPFKVDALSFIWESISGTKLQYSIRVHTDNPNAVPQPTLNISLSGIVPSSEQTFMINIPCSGVVESNVGITIFLNISGAHDNDTQLIFRRQKQCLILRENDVYVSMNSAPHFSNSTNIFYIAMACALLLICILCVIVTFYYVSDKKNGIGISLENNKPSNTTTFLASLPRNLIRNSVNTSSYSSLFQRLPSYSLIPENGKDLQEIIAELKIQRCRIRLCNIVQEGTFGKVYQGSYTNEKGEEESVLVKTVADHASEVQISLLLQEGLHMYSLNHKNILKILRVSIEDQMAPLLLYPFNSYRNMKIFLQKCKVSSEGVHHTLTTQEVVSMALQVIKGMQYLHKRNVLHKDLAARNCVVDDKLNIRIADNALSRDFFPSDYYCLGDNENRPVKWLAIESLLNKTFSAASDVWSFGVLLWELTTLAQQPYVEIDPFEMAAYLKDGYRFATIPNMSRDCYNCTYGFKMWQQGELSLATTYRDVNFAIPVYCITPAETGLMIIL